MGQKFNRSVSLLCWAYNEEILIEEFLEKASKLMSETIEDYEIILIDDGSTDRTYDIAKDFQEKNLHLSIFKNQKNENVGFSFRRAIKEASKEYLFWQTVDWCYDISNLRYFLELLNKYDIIQGVRRKPVQVRLKIFKPVVLLLRLFRIKHLTKRSDTPVKAIISVINYLLIRLLFRVPISDFQNVTIYPTKWIQAIQYEANSAFVNPEGLIKSYWDGLLIKEVPINFISRERGVAKGTELKSIWAAFKDILKLYFRWIVFGKRKFIEKGKVIRLTLREESL